MILYLTNLINAILDHFLRNKSKLKLTIRHYITNKKPTILLLVLMWIGLVQCIIIINNFYFPEFPKIAIALTEISENPNNNRDFSAIKNIRLTLTKNTDGKDKLKFDMSFRNYNSFLKYSRLYLSAPSNLKLVHNHKQVGLIETNRIGSEYWFVFDKNSKYFSFEQLYEGNIFGENNDYLSLNFYIVYDLLSKEGGLTTPRIPIEIYIELPEDIKIDYISPQPSRKYYRGVVYEKYIEHKDFGVLLRGKSKMGENQVKAYLFQLTTIQGILIAFISKFIVDIFSYYENSRGEETKKMEMTESSETYLSLRHES